MPTSGISRGTLRTCMPCKTTGLGCSMDNTCAPSWTSVEVKLEDWDCLSLSLRNKKVLVLVTGLYRGFLMVFETKCFNKNYINHHSLNRILITTSSRSKCVRSLYTCETTERELNIRTVMFCFSIIFSYKHNTHTKQKTGDWFCYPCSLKPFPPMKMFLRAITYISSNFSYLDYFIPGDGTV